MDDDPNRPVRNWLDAHPATATYVAIIVTILLFLQLYEMVRSF